MIPLGYEALTAQNEALTSDGESLYIGVLAAYVSGPATAAPGQTVAWQVFVRLAAEPVQGALVEPSSSLLSLDPQSTDAAGLAVITGVAPSAGDGLVTFAVTYQGMTTQVTAQLAVADRVLTLRGQTYSRVPLVPSADLIVRGQTYARPQN